MMKTLLRTAVGGVAVLAAAAFSPILPAGSPLATELCASVDGQPLCPQLCSPEPYPCANTVVNGHPVTCLGPAPAPSPPTTE